MHTIIRVTMAFGKDADTVPVAHHLERAPYLAPAAVAIDDDIAGSSESEADDGDFLELALGNKTNLPRNHVDNRQDVEQALVIRDQDEILQAFEVLEPLDFASNPAGTKQ